VFSLSTNQGGLVFAAMFGLVPNLFIARLQLRAESYKDDLRSSETAEHAGPDGMSVWGSPMINIPWSMLALIGIGVPLLAALAAGLGVRSRLPLTRRLGQ